jgi:hypothetical protein
MVKNVLLTAILLSSTTAFAQEADDDDDGDDAGFNMLETRIGFGTMPIGDGASSLTVSLGLGVEHPVFKRTRVFGEYEWLWLASTPVDPALMASEPEHNGSGHRAVLGLRRELVGKGSYAMHMFVDGEVGGGLGIVDDSMFGMRMLPTGFVGMRAGWDIYSHKDDSPSRTFEMNLLVRVLAVSDGVGVMTGIGMAWGS